MKLYRIFLIAIFSILLFIFFNFLLPDKDFEISNNASEFESKVELVDPIPNQDKDFVYAAEKSIDAVVHIKSKYVQDVTYRYHDPIYQFFYGDSYRYFNQPKEQTASGSGVIISSDGFIVTNNHVINNAKEIEVVLNDKRIYSAQILGVDPTTDLALLKIEEQNLSSLDFADSDNARVGEWVIAVGNPFNLNSTVTAGIISAKGRDINILRNPHAIESFIQTDAAINSGNSGGALVSTNGELIGINTAIQSQTGSYSGYGFAIPSNIVKKIVSDLKEFGEVRRAFIGIQISEIPREIAQDRELRNGVLITRVLEDGAAKKVGIQASDILLTINGIKVKSVSSLQEQISKYRPGDNIDCTLDRNGRILKFNLDLSS